jgi:AraC family transcriptional regulator
MSAPFGELKTAARQVARSPWRAAPPPDPARRPARISLEDRQSAIAASQKKAEAMYDGVLAEPHPTAGSVGAAGRPRSRPAGRQIPPASRGFPEDPALTQALIELLKSAGQGLAEDRAEASSCIGRALSLLEAEHLRRDSDREAPEPATGGLTQWRVRRVKQHIDENLEHTIRIEELASIAKLSVRHFSLAFKQTFGVPPHAHIVGRRIEKARELMLLTDEPLAQVALACGLADQAHLTKWFRRLVGATPNAWRRQHRPELATCARAATHT